jgi:RNA polymerase sigma-32 factor
MKPNAFYDQLLRRTPVMTGAEELELTRRYAATRDPKDFDRLVLGNLRLVVAIAHELGGHGRADVMDLVQEGNAGLVEAVRRFDPARGVKLATYARWWIRAFILRHLMETCRIVDPGTTRAGRKSFFAHALPLDLSLDAPVRSLGEENAACAPSAVTVFAADDGLRPDVRVEEQEHAARVREALAAERAKLDARERAILERRLLSEHPERLADVGRRLHVSGERARQLEARLVDRLRGAVAHTLGEPLPAAA